MVTHSSVLAWRIPWTEGPGGAVVYGVAESDTTKQLTHTHTQNQTVSAGQRKIKMNGSVNLYNHYEKEH